MKIEILGDGCSKCVEVQKNVRKAISELELDADVETTMDPETIAKYHALTLPVLVIDGLPQPTRLKMTLPEIKQLLQDSLRKT